MAATFEFPSFQFSWDTMLADELANAALQLLPIWFFGALVGLLLPRPKWMSGKASVLATFPFLSKTLLVCHAALILREIWKHCTHPGTFRGLARATVQWISGNGWTFSWPAHAVATSKPTEAAEASPERKDDWYVGEKDLAFFNYHAVEGGPCQGASEWQLMMDKDVPGFVRYTSWRRTLADGKTEYKSVTISPGATAREFADLYLDDDFRRNWDGMVYHHEVLEHGDFSQRQQVVRWLRRFPFSFLSDREYTIARREFIQDGDIYACTKAVHDHPREYKASSVVKMDVFWSMWRSRTVADPWGADTPACETILLHHEQFKIPENLARFAVKHGMWGFVKKLASTVPVYVEARRKRGVDPAADDPQAYGAGEVPNPPAPAGGLCSLSHSDSAMSLSSMGLKGGKWASSSSSECGSDDSARPGEGHAHSRQRSSRMKQVATLLVAGGIALAIKAHGGSRDSSSSGKVVQQRRHQRQRVTSHRLADVPELEDE